MKKAYWWILGILLSPVLLFAVLAVLLYLPPVQNWAVDKVAAIASEKTGMEIIVGHVNLRFPLDLSIDHFRVLHPVGDDSHEVDTIADVGQMVVDVQLMPLFHKRVVINELEVTNAKLNTNGFVDAAKVKGDFKRLSVTSRGIDLDEHTVELNGAQLENARFDIALNDSVPEDTTKSETPWMIHADQIAVTHSDVAFHMPGDTMSVRAHFGELVTREALVDLASQTYTVASVDWNGGTLSYDQNYVPRVSGLDVNHLDLSRLNIGIDSIYYHDPTLRMNIRQLALKEASGLELTDLSGPVTLDDGKLHLPHFRLKTPGSNVYMDLDLPLSLTDSMAPGKMRMRMDAQLGHQDLMYFLSALPKPVRERWPRYPLNVKGQLNGNLQYMEFSDLDVSLPTAFAVKADGFVANLDDMKRLRADVTFDAQGQNLAFVMAALPRDVQRNYRLPHGLRAKGRVKADGSQYSADVVAHEGQGSAKVNGTFDVDAQRYDAKISLRNLNVHHFMPRDSIYTVTADVKAKGQGFDFFSPKTSLQADAKVAQLHYGRWHLDHLTAQGSLQRGRAHADIVSRNSLVDGTLTLDALMNKHQFDGTLTADLSRADLYQMNLVDRPLSIGICGHVDISSDLKMTHTVNGFFNDLSIRDSSETYRPSDIGLLVKTRQDTTYVRAQSGDFIVKLDASGNYEQLLKKLTILSDSVMAQYDQRVIDQPAIRRLLPTMKLHVESLRENPVVTFLNSSHDIDFKSLRLDLDASPETGLNGNGYVHSLMVGDVRLDTITFRVTQRDSHLSFGGQVRNNKKNPQFVFNALFDGILQERGATMGVRYYDSADKLGARVGALHGRQDPSGQEAIRHQLPPPGSG